MFHQSVLLKESIDGLNIHPDGIYVDVTFGGGGHSAEILKHLNKGRLIAFDQDEDAIVNGFSDPRFTMVRSNFRYTRNFLKLYKAIPVDGIIADLGVSSHQIDDPERGFSTRYEGVLDMRMDQSKPLTAKQIINHYNEEKLGQIFSDYADLSNARSIARILVSSRKIQEIVTTSDLKKVLKPMAGFGKENKFFAQVFQALRIETNQELASLKELLKQSLTLLKPGGRMVILSYHSLEDRLVKDFFRSGNLMGEIKKDFYGNPEQVFRLITRKPIVAGDMELTENTRARSARLRVAEKI
ncbi:MAG: 16S rRNA (cytosine(1402)-N(4))-methyltransferase RsmH [Bacteroidota bacterium]